MILRFMEGPRSGKTIKINRDDFTIGRDDTCDLLIDEDGVSRLHCRIERKDDTFTLKDNGSTNGVRLNGEKIGESTVLKQNDTIRVGDTLLLFSSDENRLDSAVVESLSHQHDEEESAPPSDDAGPSEPAIADAAENVPDPGETQDNRPEDNEPQDNKPEEDEPGDVELNFDKAQAEDISKDGDAEDEGSLFGGSTGIMFAVVVILLVILLWLIFGK